MKNIILILFVLISLKSFSQDFIRSDFKSSLVSDIGKFKFSKTLDLIGNYKNNEIEILTLELEKTGGTFRKSFSGKLYFGNLPLSYTKEDRGLFEIGDVIFERGKPINGNTKEIYTSMKVYLERKTLYQIIIDINRTGFYNLVDQSQLYDGFYKRFEYKSNTENSKLIIETFDGDSRSYVIIKVY